MYKISLHLGIISARYFNVDHMLYRVAVWIECWCRRGVSIGTALSLYVDAAHVLPPLFSQTAIPTPNTWRRASGVRRWCMAVSQQQHYFTPLIIPPPSRPKIRWRQKHIETYIYCFPFSILFNASSCFSSFHLLFVFFDASLHSRDGSDEITPPSHRVKTSACTYIHQHTSLPFSPHSPFSSLMLLRQLRRSQHRRGREESRRI